MTISREEADLRREYAIEALLEQAPPRLTPPAQDEQRVKAAVRAEWQAVSGKRRSRRQFVRYAIAATVLLAIAVSFNGLQPTAVDSVHVASINKSYGSIYKLGEQSALYELTDLAVISSGETLITGSDSGIGIAWGNGGSLRVDEDTRVEFISDERVYLHSGRIYFDSQPAGLVAVPDQAETGLVPDIVAAKLTIETEHGSLTHLGTQYMTYSDSDTLLVSVRDGEVLVDGMYFDASAVEGEQLTFSGASRPGTVNINSYGGEWDWVEATAQSANVDGRTVDEFLGWVSRETGLKYEYENAAALEQANKATLRGTVDEKPTEALRLRMMTASLRWRIEGGTIIVSGIDSGSGL